MQCNVNASNPLILVVDDEPAIRETLSQALQDENYRTETAEDGLTAIEKVKEFQPHVVFLDIWMPGMDGIEVLQKIRQLSPNTQVIIISGHATISNAIEATKRGARDFIEKPLDLFHVLSIVKQVLASETNDAMREKAKKNSSINKFPLHPGAFTKGLKGKSIGQRTIKQNAILYGQGLHTGQRSGLILEPLPENSGIHFSNTGNDFTVPSYIEFTHSTNFATYLNNGNVSISTIEHLLSALHAYKISNLHVKCNEEVPIFDGSSIEFCRLIEDVGIEEQGGEWFEICVDKEIIWKPPDEDNDLESISILPADSLSIEYTLSYPEPVGTHVFKYSLDSIESYKEEIASARTFGFAKEVKKLQKTGLAAGGRLDNFILVGSDGVVNTELRFPNEFARHKVLDLIGDIFLLGRPVVGAIKAQMTGHSDNMALLKMISSGLEPC